MMMDTVMWKMKTGQNGSCNINIMKYKRIAVLLLFLSFYVVPSVSQAHQSGCHRWHSCPSDTGSYVCGDLGYTSGCSGYSPSYTGSSYTSPSTGSIYTPPSIPTCPLNSYYDGISSCKCSYGYVVNGDACVSADSLCHDQLGYSSTYDSISQSCKCSYGYVISGGKCTYGDSVCHSENGLYSSYNSSNKRCECDSGYTLDDAQQCVEKQNNVYFKLLDVDTDNKQAIVKSTYDSRQHFITYGTGCYASTMSRYKNKQIVINLGTDFDLDTWDTIVLQDDNETCDITRRERTYDDTLEADSADDSIYFVPSYTAPTKASVPTPPKNVDLGAQLSSDERCVKLNLGTFYNTEKQNCDTCPSGMERVAGTNNCQVPTPVVKRVENAQVKAVPPQSSLGVEVSETQKAKPKEIATTSQATTSTKPVDSPTKQLTFWQNAVSPFKKLWGRIFK